jgi:hypothetical protein
LIPSLLDFALVFCKLIFLLYLDLSLVYAMNGSLTAEIALKPLPFILYQFASGRHINIYWMDWTICIFQVFNFICMCKNKILCLIICYLKDKYFNLLNCAFIFDGLTQERHIYVCNICYTIYIIHNISLYHIYNISYIYHLYVDLCIWVYAYIYILTFISILWFYLKIWKAGWKMKCFLV